MSTPIKWSTLSPRERNALLAEIVMEWHRGRNKSAMWFDKVGYPRAGWSVWSPTTCPKDCAEVKAKFPAWSIMRYDTGGFGVFISGKDDFAKTEEEAFCLCALRARGIEVEA